MKTIYVVKKTTDGMNTSKDINEVKKFTCSEEAKEYYNCLREKTSSELGVEYDKDDEYMEYEFMDDGGKVYGMIEIIKEKVEREFKKKTGIVYKVEHYTNGVTSTDDEHESKVYKTQKKAYEYFDKLCENALNYCDMVRQDENHLEYTFRDNGAQCYGYINITEDKLL